MHDTQGRGSAPFLIGKTMMEAPNPHTLLDDFTHNLEALRAAVPLSMSSAKSARKNAGDEHLKFLEENGELEEETDKVKRFKLRPEHYRKALQLRRRYERMKTALRLIPRNFLVSFVSEFDAFIGQLLKATYYLQPELLNASEKQMTFSDLSKMSSIEAARELIVEKEVESVLRKSHSDQFAWLERNLSLKLRQDLDSWPHFIELTERRNLFVHCNGEVSHQYLAVCRLNGVDVSGRLARNCTQTIDT